LVIIQFDAYHVSLQSTGTLKRNHKRLLQNFPFQAVNLR
jgi:hypothetical protein